MLIKTLRTPIATNHSKMMGRGFLKLRGSMYSVLDDEALDFQDDAEAAIGIVGHVQKSQHDPALQPP